MKRSDLPVLAYTREPDGKVHLLINGKAVFGGFSKVAASYLREAEITTKQGFWDGPAWVLYLARDIPGYSLPEVAWSTLGEIAAVEHAEGKAPAEQFDYRDLLKRYIEHVGDCEGTTFITKLNEEPSSDVRFTADEVEEMERIEREIREAS